MTSQYNLICNMDRSMQPRTVACYLSDVQRECVAVVKLSIITTKGLWKLAYSIALNITCDMFIHRVQTIVLSYPLCLILH